MSFYGEIKAAIPKGCHLYKYANLFCFYANNDFHPAFLIFQQANCYHTNLPTQVCVNPPNGF